MADFRSKLIVELSDAEKAKLLKGLGEIEAAEKKLGSGVSAGAAKATPAQKRDAEERIRQLKQVALLLLAENEALKQGADAQLKATQRQHQADVNEAKFREQLEARAQAAAREAAAGKKADFLEEIAFLKKAEKDKADATRKQMQLDKEAAAEKKADFLEEIAFLKKAEHDEAAATRRQMQLDREKAAEQARLLRQQQKDADALRMGRLPTFVQFAAYPIGSLAQRLGAQGAANAIFGAGDLLGTADSFTVIGDGIRALGTRLQDLNGPIGMVARGAAGLVGGLGTVAGGFASVLAVVAPVGIALLGLVAIVSEAQRRAEEERKRAQQFFAAEIDAGEVVARGGGTQALQDYIGEKQTRSAPTRSEVATGRSLLGRYDDLQQRIDNFASRSAGLSSSMGGGLPPDLAAEEQQLQDEYAAIQRELQETTRGAISSFDVFRAAIDELDRGLAPVNEEIAAANALLGTTAVAANDANQTLLAGLDAIEENIRREQRLDDLRRGASQAVEQAIRAQQLDLDIAKAQIPTILAQANANAEFNDEAQAAQAAIETMSGDLAELKRVLKEVQIREFAEKVLKAFREGLADFAKLAASQEEAYREIDERFAERRRDLDERFTETDLEARIKYNEDLDKLKRDFDAANTEDEIKAREDEADLQEKFDDQREDQLQEHHRRLQEIEDDYQYDKTIAVAERDALAAKKAEIQRDKDVKKENERYAALEQERDDDFKRQKQDLKNHLDEQRRARQRDYDRRLSELLIAFRQEEQQRARKYTNDLNQLAREYEQERVLQAQEFVRSFNALRDHLIAKAGIENSFFRWIEARARAMIANVGGTAPAATTSSTPPIQYTIPSTYQFRQQGGPLEAYRDTVVGEDGPEVLRVPMRGAHVYTLDQYRQMGGHSRERGSGPQSMNARIVLDGPATTRLLEGKVVDVIVAIEGAA